MSTIRTHHESRLGGTGGGWTYMRIGGQVIVFFLLALALIPPAQAAVFNIPAGDVAALINAINTANGNGEEDTINLAAGTYILTAVDNDTDGPNGLPSITSPLTMHGAGAKSTFIERDASAPGFRILHIAAAGVLELDGVTITGGVGEGGEVFGDGGGLFNAGELTLTTSTVSGNTGLSGGGLFNADTGKLTLTTSTISGNNLVEGEGFGSGLFNAGTAILMHSTVSGNLGDFGVGLFNIGMLTLENTTVTDNAGIAGGGLDNAGTATLTNTTISGNAASDFGAGGLRNDGLMQIINSTIAGNVAAPGATVGGLLNFGTMELTRTIVAGNAARDCFNDSGALISQGHNLVGAGTGCPSDGPGDLTVNPAEVFTTVLGPLQNNGGPTETHALVEGSPAIDAGGSDCPPPDTDQRGVTRPQDGDGDGTATCDIGAFELGPLNVSGNPRPLAAR